MHNEDNLMSLAFECMISYILDLSELFANRTDRAFVVVFLFNVTTNSILWCVTVEPYLSRSTNDENVISDRFFLGVLIMTEELFR